MPTYLTFSELQFYFSREAGLLVVTSKWTHPDPGKIFVHPWQRLS